LDSLFWKGENDKLWAVVGKVMAQLLMEGAKNGEEMIPANLRVLVNWDVFDNRIINTLTNLRTDWWDRLNDTTRINAQAEIEAWLKAGEKISRLDQRFVTKGIFSPERAGRIAVTEVTRVIARGSNDIWASTGFIYAGIWHTGNDDRVCDLCSSLEGTHIGVEDTDSHPPAHTGCRCYETPEVDMDAVNAMLDEILAKAGQ
jgi:SPP1 gp7 family putative phage head morphogenesis protein